jgi:hypothetical protein
MGGSGAERFEEFHLEQTTSVQVDAGPEDLRRPLSTSPQGCMCETAHPLYNGSIRGDEGNRTPDILLAKQVLYQLSYVPKCTELCVPTKCYLCTSI